MKAEIYRKEVKIRAEILAGLALMIFSISLNKRNDISEKHYIRISNTFVDLLSALAVSGGTKGSDHPVSRRIRRSKRNTHF